MDLETKKRLIHEKAVEASNQEFLDQYDKLEIKTIMAYRSDLKLAALSSNFDVAKLPESEKLEVQNLLSNPKFIAVLIDKMINHEGFLVYSMYRMLYSQNHPELILNDGEIFLDDQLMNNYVSKGGGAAALAEMNAEIWLNSVVGESYLAE